SPCRSRHVPQSSERRIPFCQYVQCAPQVHSPLLRLASDRRDARQRLIRQGTASSVPTPVGSTLVVSRRRGRCACTSPCYVNPPAALASCPPAPAAAYGGVKAKGVSARAHGRRNVADSAIVEGPLARLAALGVGDGRSTPTTELIPTAGGSQGPEAAVM